ncbi:acyltransferase [Streptomyces sp. NBC_00233]|uniref:acyltransferase n=1 Tax=Streptomyces sp. NBC_00233 TaxID=2975686 RepID=UPI002259811B|nr:acyltransferase [Streptomyces sp. NBC_00233]MCX5231273.1 acyltransferase [Streptomyces sp. NBC_00233]
MGTEEVLRLTVAALMARAGERQNDVAVALGQSQAQVSRKQSGRAHWSLEDVDLLAAHYGMHVLDLLAGPTHAAGVLHGSLDSLHPVGTQSSSDPGGAPAAAAVVDEAAAVRAAVGEASGADADRVRDGHTLAPQDGPDVPMVVAQPVQVRAVEAQPCVLCGQPTPDELEGFPQHLSAEECAAAVTAVSTSQPVAFPAQDLTPVSDAPDGPTSAHAVPSGPAPAVPRSGPVPTVPSVPPAPSSPDSAPASEPAPEPAPASEAALVPEPVDQSPAPPESAPTAPADSTVLAPTTPAGSTASASAGLRHGAPAYAAASLVEEISDRVHEVLAACSGDREAAQAELIKMAIPDVMRLLKSSRVGGRYEHSEFPPTQDVLRKRSQKGADEIWEGRPKWRNPELFAAAKRGQSIEVTALDMNAAYLSALKCWLPIGQLKEDTSGVHDRKKAGVHLITPADWDHADLPNPLGNRMEPGELWVSESTLRLLLDCARQDLVDAPVIHRSLVSGATEALLEKLRRALAESRRTALAEGDELAVAYVKAMYSKFVSTIGESSANRELRRPDWMHIIRAKAFANLWMKAHKAHKAGLKVVEISGTDELHVVGDWRPVFPEGRDLNQVKEKATYILGGKR